MSAFFVTATGTGIGKTFITAGLVKYLRGEGRDAAVLKPVVTGYDGPSPDCDPVVLLEAMDEIPNAEAVARIAPWRFKAPLSPDMAAMREGREVPFDDLIAFCRAEEGKHDTLMVEGVGGVMVPLDARHTVLDWMGALRLPVLLVTGSYLGTLSHTLTAVAALERTKLKVASLVVNDSGDGAVPLTDTAATLHRFLPQLEIAILPRGALSLDFAPLAQALSRTVNV
jgi:dethiobiotin synthetase